MKIEVLDPIECRVSKRDGLRLKPCLSFKSVFWRKGQFKKVQREYRKDVFSIKGKDYWYFYTGNLQRVIDFCKKKGWETNVIYNKPCDANLNNIHIPGIKLRKDQEKVVDSALAERTGVIQEPTGTGKTVLQMALMSAIEGNILLLAHTSSIVNQTVDKIRKAGWDCIQIGGGSRGISSDIGLAIDACSNLIMVSTVQSFAKIPVHNYKKAFDCVVVDEAHRVSAFDGQYAKVLKNIDAPFRYGFTATLPVKAEAKFALEAFIGTLISTRSINEAIESKILATPKIKIIKSSFKQKVRNEKNYNDVYRKGIIENVSRNKQIIKIIKGHKEKGESSLIFVNEIEHGKILVSLFLREGIRVPFIKGDMPDNKREVIKTSLIKKKRKIVIATTAWKEGVDIPSLDVVFNASGGKSEIAIIQAIGRVLRRTEEKTRATIYDFFDPSHPYLISHFGERITLYMDNNWI